MLHGGQKDKRKKGQKNSGCVAHTIKCSRNVAVNIYIF